jgi:hypothetical protein
MGIREQVADAKFLADNNRHLGALTMILVAIGASSRRLYPFKKTQSIRNPQKIMGDEEAFTLFLGERLNSLIGGFGEYKPGNQGYLLEYQGNMESLEYILYKFYRCDLVHQGILRPDIGFSPSTIKGVSMATGDVLMLGGGWIDLLIQAVVDAPCNGKEFGIKHLVAKPSIVEKSFKNEVAAQHATSIAKINVLLRAVRFITPETINLCKDDELGRLFGELVQDNRINGGAITGLSSNEITDDEGRLLKKGTDIIRVLAEAYHLE